MFAPHCSTCRCRVLLGADRIVHFAWDGEGHRVVILRCTCGELVDWDARPPAHDAPGSGPSVPADACLLSA